MIDLSDEIKHNLDLSLMNEGDIIAFFAVIMFDRSIDVTSHSDMEQKIIRRLVPLFIELDNQQMTREERLSLADYILHLGKKIKEAAEK